MNLHIYVIFHERVFPELLLDIPDTEHCNVTLYAVNEHIAKPPIDPSLHTFTTLAEYDLPHFEPHWQHQGWCQTSCMIHVYKQPTYFSTTDYIGFTQYDMKFKPATFQHIRATVEATPETSWIFYHQSIPAVRVFDKATDTDWNAVLQHYNAFFGTRWTTKTIAETTPMPMLHTFVLPRDIFDKMMAWMTAYLDTIQDPHTYPSCLSQAEFGERLHGLFLALECLRTPKTTKMIPLHIDHIWPHYHDLVPFDGYKCRH